MSLSALHIEHLKRYRSPATRVLSLGAPFAMHRGGELAALELAYECWGALAPTRDNVVLLFTGLSPSAHAASSGEDPEPGWWEWMIGPGRPIDTRRLHVLCVNSLGSCFGSSGPASLNPQTKSPYGLAFPELSIEDIARSAGLLLDTLGIERVHTVLGASMGGMSALAFAQAFPGRTARLGVISGCAQASACKAMCCFPWRSSARSPGGSVSRVARSAFMPWIRFRGMMPFWSMRSVSPP